MDIHESDILSYNDKAICKIHETTTLINALLLSCQDKEFKGQYYDLPQNSIYKLSEERNGYITLICMALEKLNSLQKIQLNIENTLTSLHQDSNYSS